MNSAQLPRRPYGNSGEELSIIGLGGVLVWDLEPRQAARLVAEAVERGVNYFDVAPSYGNAEEVLGPALEPYRARVFLACKTLERTRAGTAAELERSLGRLRTSHFDLYQFHALNEIEKDVDAVFARGGALEAALEARRAGRIRHIGFSTHAVTAALAALERFDFDSVLFPVNHVMWRVSGFGPQIVAKAAARGAARLALKATAIRPRPQGDARRQFPKCWYVPATGRTAELALRFTLGQSVTAAIPPGDESLFRQALDVAAAYRPLDADELAELHESTSTEQPILCPAQQRLSESHETV